MRGRGALWLNVGLKVLLVALLAFGAFSGAQQFEGKAFGRQLVTYPFASLIVPLGWLLARRPRPYPTAADMLLTAPFLVDVIGNALDLYDTVWWWDDANHLVNWALLSGAAGVLLRRQPLGRWTVIGLVVGFGAVTAIGWELAEYVAFIRNSPELEAAYTDTLGDLALGLTGSVIAAFATGWVRPVPRSTVPLDDVVAERRSSMVT